MTLIVLFALASCAEASSPVAAPEPIGEVLEVSCDGTTTSIPATDVRALRDGVHVLVHNTSGSRVLVGWSGKGAAGGDGADPGDTSFRLGIWPGDAKFRCQEDTPAVDPGEPGGWASFRIEAPDGWVDPALECHGGTFSGGIADYVPGAQGVDDPLEDAQKQAGDAATVLQAGYVTGREQTFIATVDGTVEQAFTYHADGTGGWLLGQTDGC